MDTLLELSAEDLFVLKNCEKYIPDGIKHNKVTQQFNRYVQLHPVPSKKEDKKGDDDNHEQTIPIWCKLK